MKLTKKRLKQLIREELGKINETAGQGLFLKDIMKQKQEGADVKGMADFVTNQVNNGWVALLTVQNLLQALKDGEEQADPEVAQAIAMALGRN